MRITVYLLFSPLREKPFAATTYLHSHISSPAGCTRKTSEKRAITHPQTWAAHKSSKKNTTTLHPHTPKNTHTHTQKISVLAPKSFKITPLRESARKKDRTARKQTIRIRSCAGEKPNSFACARSKSRG